MTRGNISSVRRSENRADKHREDRRQRQRTTTGSEGEDGGLPPSNTSSNDEGTVVPVASSSSMFTSIRDVTWAPQMATVFKLLVSVRISSAIWSPISDCDEVYNYWEPLHLWLYGKGMQTWEYSPLYAIRSYAYIALHALPVLPFHALLPNTKIATFFYVRCFIAFVETLTSLYLYSGIRNRLGNGVARYYIAITLCSTGMFISSSAFLPSSFAMLCLNATLGAYLHDHLVVGVIATAVGALVGWPFAAVLGLPIACAYVFHRRDIVRFVLIVLSVGLLVGSSLVAVDSHFYGRRTLAPLNIVMYNMFSTHGPSLYGTSPLSYYVVNLFLNWNVMATLALITVPLTYVAILNARQEEQLIMDKKEMGQRSTLGSWHNISPMIYTQSTMWLWLAIFGTQPHKEERFLFPIYPLIAVSAALSLYSVEALLNKMTVRVKQYYIGYISPMIVVAFFALLSLSRIVALYRGYHAPFDVYIALNERVTERSRAGNLPEHVNACVGKEWHRFPSSFFLPDQRLLNGSEVSFHFVKSEFSGLLPDFYDDRLPFPEITRHIPMNQNDANEEEMDRYMDVRLCDYMIDLETVRSSELEPNYAQSIGEWSIVKTEKFLLAEYSDRFFRAFYVPLLSPRHVTMGNYMLLERIGGGGGREGRS